MDSSGVPKVFSVTQWTVGMQIGAQERVDFILVLLLSLAVPNPWIYQLCFMHIKL